LKIFPKKEKFLFFLECNATATITPQIILMLDGSSSLENFGPCTWERETNFANDIINTFPSNVQISINAFGYPGTNKVKSVTSGFVNKTSAIRILDTLVFPVMADVTKENLPLIDTCGDIYSRCVNYPGWESDGQDCKGWSPRSNDWCPAYGDSQTYTYDGLTANQVIIVF
jgi:hypothetical protein